MLGKFGRMWDEKNPLHAAIDMLNELGGGHREAARRRAAMALYKTVLAGSGQLTEENLLEVRQLLTQLPPNEIDELIDLLRSADDISADELAGELADLPTEEKHRLVENAVKLAIRSHRLEENRAYLAAVAAHFQYEPGEFDAQVAEIAAKDGSRRRILRSGAGILTALIVIGVFVITATLLKSVIFGLILAYIMLPAEQFFYRRLCNPRSALYRLTRGFDALTAPLRRFSAALRRQPPLSQEEREKREQSSRTTRAVSLTAVSFFAFIAAVLIVFSVLVNNYVSNLKARSDARRAAAEPVAVAEPGEPASPADDMLSTVKRQLDKLRRRFDQTPVVQYAVNTLERMLNDPHTQEELLKHLLQRTGGMVSVTTGILAAICSILADLLLTIFFFLLFLSGLARFCSGNSGADRQSEYLVRTVFNGQWLPGAREETVAEAERILSEVINKLKVWVRGYLTLMLVDSTVYTTLFYFLKVPYFFILGPLAGCGILLPYIGPIVSGGLTILVTLAVGGADVPTGRIVGILCCYLIYNGIIEQFILYPLVIGESLGLTTLETIIVVLLGAIFAGITGMILALPAASIIKYLVPQIYHCFDPGTPPKRT